MDKILKKILAVFMILVIISGCSATETSPVIMDREGKDIDSYTDPNTIQIDYVDNDKRTLHEILYDEAPIEATNNSWEADDTIEVEGKYQDIFPVVTNKTPIDEMVSEIEDLRLASGMVYITFCPQPMYLPEHYRDDFSIRSFNLLNDGHRTEFNTYVCRTPINFLRKMDVEGWYYSANKFNDGYIYYFFGPLNKYYPATDEDSPFEAECTDPTDIYFYGAIYAKNIRSLKDFDSIGIGSSISDVIEVDSSAELTLGHYRFNRVNMEFPSYAVMRSYHLLTDGILEITYEPRHLVEYETLSDGRVTYENDGDDLVVCNMVYFKDFNYSPSRSPSVTDTLQPYYKNVVVPMHIFSYDYPKQ